MREADGFGCVVVRNIASTARRALVVLGHRAAARSARRRPSGAPRTSARASTSRGRADRSTSGRPLRPASARESSASPPAWQAVTTTVQRKPGPIATCSTSCAFHVSMRVVGQPDRERQGRGDTAAARRDVSTSAAKNAATSGGVVTRMIWPARQPTQTGSLKRSRSRRASARRQARLSAHASGSGGYHARISPPMASARTGPGESSVAKGAVAARGDRPDCDRTACAFECLVRDTPREAGECRARPPSRGAGNRGERGARFVAMRSRRRRRRR